MRNATIDTSKTRRRQSVVPPASLYLLLAVIFLLGVGWVATGDQALPADSGRTVGAANEMPSDSEESTSGLLPDPEAVRQAWEMAERFGRAVQGERHTGQAPIAGTGVVSRPAGGPQTWTFLFYDDAEFVGYNPLEDFAAEACSGPNLDVIVLEDSETTPAYVHYVDQNHQTVLLEEWGEVDMGSYSTLRDFLEYGKTNYPADRYFLAMYDHGGGWSGACMDLTDDGWLDMDELGRAIYDSGGVDILAFTAPCLMGAVESVYELRNSVDVYIGSAELSGYIHWRGMIDDLCDLLKDSSQLSSLDIGVQVVEMVDANSPPPYHSQLTLSASDAAGTVNVAAAVETLAGHLLERIESVAGSIALARDVTFEYGLDYTDNFEAVDLGQFLEEYAARESDPVILQDIEYLLSSLDQVIVAEAHGEEEEGSHGLSIFFPRVEGDYNPSYPLDDLDFAEDSAWNDFVVGYLEFLGTGVPTLVTGPGPGPHNPPLVRTFDPFAPSAPQDEWSAYGVDAWGVNVACGKLDADNHQEVVVGPGPGTMFGPHVRGFDRFGQPLPGISFLAYGTNKYGVNVACGNLDGGSLDEIITGAGPGAVFGPHVRGWRVDGGTVSSLAGVNFLAYGTNKFGVNVACGDLDGDGLDEIVTGAGPGAVFGPHVRGWNVDGGTASAMPGLSYMAYGTQQWGVNVACGDFDEDGIDEIVTGAGPGIIFSAHVRGWEYDGASVTAMANINFFAYPASQYRYGVRVSAMDLHVETRDEIITVTGPDPSCPAWVRAWRVMYSGSVALIDSCDFQPYHDLDDSCGGTVAGGNL